MGIILFLIIWAASFAICRALCIRFEEYFEDLEIIGLILSVFPIFNIPMILLLIGIMYCFEEDVDEKIEDWFFKRKD